MRYRALGTTGIVVSEIGFGAWGIGGRTPGATSYGATDDGVSRAALVRALDLGVTFFDTANVYGAGHSEQLLGDVLAPHRERVVLATKAGRTDYTSGHDYSPGALRRSLDGSLERLRTTYVDLFQLHGPTVAELAGMPTTLAALEALRGNGGIRAWGVSVRSPAEGLAAIERLRVPVVQVNFNLADRRAIDCGLLDLAARLGVGIIARTPLCFGFLTGRLAPDTVFAADDHRSRWPREQIVRWATQGRAVLEDVARAERQTPAQVALRFCLSHAAVATVIPGMLRPAEVEENVAASDGGPLPEPLAATLAVVGTDSGVLSGHP